MLLVLPFYTPKDKKRKKEIFNVLETHLNKNFIDKILLLIDDDTYLNEITPSKKIVITRFKKRPSYSDWIKESKKFIKKNKFLVCLNSDIELKDDFYSKISLELTTPKSVLMISRYEKINNNEVELRKNPHWTQDTWCISSADIKNIDESFLKSMEIPFGYPRCDNKIAYEFAIRDWKIINPCERIITVHHQESDSRNYSKKDKTILGGVAYVYPNKEVAEKSLIDISIFTLAKKTLPLAKISQWLSHDTYIYDSIYDLDQNNYQKYIDLVSLLKPEYFYFKNSLSKIIGENIDIIYRELQEFVENNFKSKKSTLFWNECEDYEKNYYEFNKKNNNLISKINDKVKIYLPLPWSGIIDRKITLKDQNLQDIFNRITGIYHFCKEFHWELEIHTFCNHKKYENIIEIFKMFKITDLHITNYSEGKKNIEQMKVHKFLSKTYLLKDTTNKDDFNLENTYFCNDIFKNFDAPEFEFLNPAKNNVKMSNAIDPPLSENYSEWITLLTSVINARGTLRMAAIGNESVIWLVKGVKAAFQKKIYEDSDKINRTELLGLVENQIEYENLINQFIENKIKINNQYLLLGEIKDKSESTRFRNSKNLEKTKNSIENNSSVPLETYSFEEIFNKFSGNLDIMIINVDGDRLNYLETKMREITSLVKLILIKSKIKNGPKLNTKKVFKDFGWEEDINYPKNFLDQTKFNKLKIKNDILIFSNPSLI